VKTAVLINILIAALTVPPCLAGDWSGTGKDFGRGWASDTRGGAQGTGQNFGRGWAPDGRGGWVGTGKDFGRGYRGDGVARPPRTSDTTSDRSRRP
jgi:hypothetical protein